VRDLIFDLYQIATVKMIAVDGRLATTRCRFLMLWTAPPLGT
jgi:hypothetical protein